MREQKEIRASHKMLAWALGLGLLVCCLSCATAPPKPETSPSHPVEPTSATQEASPPLPPTEPVLLPKETPPAVVKTPPIRQEPAPQRPSTAAAPALTPKKTFYAHKVKWCGETLSIIATWYTGDWKNWKSIAEANPQIKPNRIYEGIEIQIPGSLLKTQDGMPKEFVEKFYANTKREKSQPKSQSTWTQEEDVKLFGPKKSSK